MVLAVARVDTYESPSSPGTSHVLNFAAPDAGWLGLLCIGSDAVVSGVSLGSVDESLVDFTGTYLYEIVADGTETSVTITTTSGAATVAALVWVSGADTAAALDVDGHTIAPGGTSSLQLLDLTTTNADDLLIAFWVAPSAGDPLGFAPLSSQGYTEQCDLISTTGQVNLLVGTKIVSAAGTQTGPTATLASAFRKLNGIHAAYKQGAGGADVTGAAAITGTGTLSASGVRTRLGAAAVAGAGALSATGVRTRLGAAQIAGSGSVAATGVRTRFGRAAVAGVGTLGATGVRTRTGEVAISGAGTLSATGVRTVRGAAAVRGVGAISVDTGLAPPGTFASWLQPSHSGSFHQHATATLGGAS